MKFTTLSGLFSGVLRQLLTVGILTFGSLTFLSADGDWLAGNNNDYPVNTIDSVRAAIEDMIDRFGDDYADGEAYLDELDELEAAPNHEDPEWIAKFDAFRRKALLANPLLDDLKLLVVRSKGRVPAPRDNFYTMLNVPREDWDTEFAILDDLRSDNPTYTPFFSPRGDAQSVSRNSIGTESG